MIDAQISSYRLIQEIGSGTYGTVYHGVHLHDPSLEVAIKVVDPIIHNDPGFIAALKQECRALDRLDHPGIVRFRELVVQDDVVAMVMELLRGADLETVLQTGPQPVEEVTRILQLALTGLSHAHQSGVIHRDIKPANIFRCADGRVKLMDFGISRAADGSQSTRTGPLKGTLDYIAPERFSNQTTPAADVYALGLVAWELLVGERACPDGDIAAKLGWHMSIGIPSAQSRRADCPEWLAALLSAMSHRLPSERPQDGAAALAILEAHLSSASPQTSNDESQALDSAATTSAAPSTARGPQTVILAKTPSINSEIPAPTAARIQGGEPIPEPGPATTPPTDSSRKKQGLLVGVLGVGALLVGGAAVLGVLLIGGLVWWMSSSDDPDEVVISPYYTTGMSLLQGEHYMLGWRSLEQCHRESPANIDCLWEAGWGAWQLEDWEEVISLWEKIEATTPTHASLQTHLPQARQKLNSARSGWSSLSSGQRAVQGVILDRDDQPQGCLPGKDFACDLRMAPYQDSDLVLSEVQRRIDGAPLQLPAPPEDCTSLADYAESLGVVGIRSDKQECEIEDFCAHAIKFELRGNASLSIDAGWEWYYTEMTLPGFTMDDGWTILQACAQNVSEDELGFDWQSHSLDEMLARPSIQGPDYDGCSYSRSARSIEMVCTVGCDARITLSQTSRGITLVDGGGC